MLAPLSFYALTRGGVEQKMQSLKGDCIFSCFRHFFGEKFYPLIYNLLAIELLVVWLSAPASSLLDKRVLTIIFSIRHQSLILRIL